MNLETLLEAAKYVEYSSKVKARGEEPEDYNTYERQCACDDQLITRLNQKSHIKSDPDTPKEKRRLTGVLVSKEVPVFSDEAQGIGTREVHNKLEKNRRAHLKECFENLKRQLPSMDERKTSNLSILRGALRYIQTLKKREQEYEHEMERLAGEKIAAQQKLAALRKELSINTDLIEVNVLPSEGDSETTTTASECGQLSDIDDDDVQHEISFTSLQHNSSSSEVTSPTSSTISNAATSDSITGTVSLGSLSADETVRLSKLVKTSFSSEELTSLSSSVATSPSPLASLAAVSASCLSVTPSISKQQASVTLPSLPSGSSVLHGTPSISQPTAAHVSLSSQVTGSRSFQVSTMTGMVTNPRTVQVITQQGPVKVIATPSALAGNTPVCNAVTAAPIQNGSLHILTSNTSLMALGAPSTSGSNDVVSTSSKTSGTQSLVHVTPLSVNSTKHLMSPVTLVAPHAVVGVTQVATAPKPIIMNQVASLGAPSPGTAVTSSVTAESATMTASSALTSKHNIVTAAVVTQSNVVTPLQTSHIVQSGITPRSNATSQVLSTSVLAPQVNNVGHQIVTASIKSVSPVAHSPMSQLSNVAHMTHVMSQAPATASVGHIVPAGGHMSAMTPLVTPISMVSHSAGAHHPQVYTAQSQQLGKAITSPVLKPVGQIPIMQQQLLQPTVGAQPVVVVSMAPASNGPPVPVVVTSTSKQVGTISVKVTQ